MLANLVAIHPAQHLLIAEPFGVHHHKFMVMENQGLNLQSFNMMQNLLTMSPSSETMPPEFYMSFEQIC